MRRNKFDIIAIALLFALVPAGIFAQGVDISLHQEGRFFLPLENRFQPGLYDFSGIGETDTTLALLDYSTLNHRYSAVVFWGDGFVVIDEWVLDRQIYASRVVPIDQFKLFMANRYWRNNAWEGSKEEAKARRDGLSFEIPIDFPKGVRDIIGEGGAGLRVSGYRRITLSGRSTWITGQEFGPNQSKFPSLQMEQESRFTITGTIGSKISVTVDQDSKRETDLENTINIAFTGEEDDIIQKIEAGNTNLSLPGATFVGYSERVEGLFGIKSQFQIGDWAITAIASQEKGQHETTTITGNTSTQPTDIREYNYLDLTYFWIDSSFIYPFVWPVTANPYMAGDSIVEFTLWVDDQISSNNIANGAIEGVAMPNPGDPYVSDVGHRGYFHTISQEYYQIYRRLGWFYMTGSNPLSNNHAIACSYIIRRADGTQDTVGGLYIDPTSGDTTLQLNLIRPPAMRSNNPCWEQTWRNVYYLSSTNINTDNLEVEIFLNPVTNDIRSDTTQSPPRNFLEVFGLDELNTMGNYESDGRVDAVMVNPQDGHLIFPVLHPFNPSEAEMASTRMNLGPNTPRVRAMYTSSTSSEIAQDHQYIIRLKTGQRQNPMSLGRFNIIENSEIVKLGGRRLQSGIDYRVDYQIGQITFLNDEALNPNTTLTIDFDYEPFFMPEQKALLGARAEYRFGEQSWIGGTAIYKSTSSAERRPRIGREPGKAFIWDADLQLDYEVPFITDAVNAIPLIHTESASKIRFTAEVAQVISNPNTKDEAYIDDFEGSRSTFNLEIRRTAWKKSSAPQGKTQDDRGHLIWYNPYDKVAVKEIWPQKDVATEDSRTNVLVLEFDPDSVGGGTDKWAGVMRYITTGYHDQSKSRFLEVWVRGNEGHLHFNFGSINEDINGDGVLNSEDLEVAGYRDGILSAAEDVGLDGLPDSLEPGYHPVNNPDPNGDNWHWSKDNPNDYSKINGTEGNGRDPEGGTKPDTEDLNGNNFLDTNNDYFEFTIDLSSSEFEVPNTRNIVEDGTDEYWRLYRIPIQDSVYTHNPDGKVHRRKEVGSPDWERIRYSRIWVDGVERYSKIQIAQIELVGNKWEEKTANIEIATKNTHEDGDYVSPPGVTGERSVTTGIMSQEQSLAILYDKVPGQSVASCFRTTFAGESMDLTLYQALDMWVYFNKHVSDDSVLFFFKLGRDANNTYEYRTYLQDGWVESNRVMMDFPEMTAFKNEYQTAISDTSIPNIDPIYRTENGWYIINGSPTLTDVRYFEMGVINPYRFRPISGEIWVDELRVTNVRKEPGWAEKATFSMNFADLADFSGTLERKDSEFHGLNERVGTGRTETVLSLSGGFKPHKFAPDRWGLNLPVSSNFSRRISVPRLKTGSDISVPDTLRQQETTTTKQYSVNITETLKPRDPHWLIGLTLSRLSHSVSAGETREISPTYPLRISRNWNLRQTYDLTPTSKNWNVHLTRWMFADKKDDERTEVDSVEGKPSSPISPPKGTPSRPGARIEDPSVPRLLDLSLNFAPTALRFETNLTGREEERFDRYDTRTYSNEKSLTHTATLNTNIMPPITTGFILSMKRDIGDSAHFRWKHPVVIGNPLSKSISQNVRYTPAMISWLSQNYEIRGEYKEDTDPARYRDRFGVVNLNRSFRASWGIKWKQLGSAIGGTTSGSSPMPPRRETPRDRGGRQGEEEPPTPEQPAPSGSRESTGGLKKALAITKPLFDNLDDLNFDWQFDDRRQIPNLAGRPDLWYQLSLTTDPGVHRVTDSLAATSQIESHTTTEKRNIRTGTRLPFKMTLQARYNYVKNVTISTNNTKQIQTTFPDVTLNWNGLGQIPPFKTLASNARANSNYSYEVRENYESNALKNDVLTHSFNPLVSINMTWKPGISTDYSTNLRNSHERTYSATSVNIRHNYELSHKITAGYSIRGSKGFKLPIIGTLKFENQLTLSLTVQNTTRITESWVEGATGEVSRSRDDVEWSITPSASYNFSRNIRGGLELKWIDTNNRRIEQITHVRDVSIWVELKF